MGKRKHSRYKVFVSHGSADQWVAEQIASRIAAMGSDTFIDVFDVEKGDDIEARVFEELQECQELVALLTPWSADRNWVWIEIGAARMRGIRVVAVLYGLTLANLDGDKGGRAFLGAKNIVEINELDDYFFQLEKRVAR